MGVKLLQLKKIERNCEEFSAHQHPFLKRLHVGGYLDDFGVTSAPH